MRRPALPTERLGSLLSDFASRIDRLERTHNRSTGSSSSSNGTSSSGVPGLQGDPGATGPAGPPGADGAPGADGIDGSALGMLVETEERTTIGDAASSAGSVVLSVTSKWGITSTGDVYFDDAGSTLGEEAMLSYDHTNGSISWIEATDLNAGPGAALDLTEIDGGPP